MGWEYFRAEMLYHGDETKKKTSADNAEKLRRYLRDLATKHEIIAEVVREASF
jgi:hypothetical protein